MPRFAILTHDHPHLHWDFLLEAGEALRAWRLDGELEIGGGASAMALPDHRLIYLDYEGPVSGGRGTVTRWDSGTYEAERWEPDEIQVTLRGERILGQITLRQVDGTKWRLELS